MNKHQPSRLLVICSRPEPGPGERQEAVRLAGSVRDWDEVLGMAEKEGILPLLYWNLRDDPGAVPASVMERLRVAFLRNLAWTTQVYREAEPFLESIHRSGLRAAVTKGGRLALDIYPDIALRPFWDMDFVVHPADWPELMRVLARLGFIEACVETPGPPRASAPALDWTYSPYFKKGSVFFEFHANPLGLHFPSPGEDGFWSSAGRLRVRGTEALVLPAENELCYLCVHAQQHSYQKLIWLSDIAGLAGRAGLDWAWVSRIARDERIKGPVFYGLYLAGWLWPGAVPSDALAGLRPGPAERAGLRLLWPKKTMSSRRAAAAWPYYMPSIFSLLERRDTILAVRTLRQIFFPPRAWLASTSGLAAASPRLYGRYVERLFRPALTAARRMLGIR